MGLRGLRDKTFLSAEFGIGYKISRLRYEIQFEQMSFRMPDITKKQLWDTGNDLMFLPDAGSMQPYKETFSIALIRKT